MMDSKQAPPPNYTQSQAGYPQQPAYPQGQPPQQQPYPQGGPPPAGYPQGGYAQPPPPQGGYAPQGAPPQGYAQPAATTVVINQTVSANMSEVPVNMTCTQCRANITTRVVYTNGMLVWLICLVLILFGCWLGCCLIPFCMDSVKDVEHYCPSCNCMLGTKKRM